jgi:hypothetical protein
LDIERERKVPSPFVGEKLCEHSIGVLQPRKLDIERERKVPSPFVGEKLCEHSFAEGVCTIWASRIANSLLFICDINNNS